MMSQIARVLIAIASPRPSRRVALETQGTCQILEPGPNEQKKGRRGARKALPCRSKTCNPYTAVTRANRVPDDSEAAAHANLMRSITINFEEGSGAGRS